MIQTISIGLTTFSPESIFLFSLSRYVFDRSKRYRSTPIKITAFDIHTYIYICIRMRHCLYRNYNDFPPLTIKQIQRAHYYAVTCGNRPRVRRRHVPQQYCSETEDSIQKMRSNRTRLLRYAREHVKTFHGPAKYERNITVDHLPNANLGELFQ